MDTVLPKRLEWLWKIVAIPSESTLADLWCRPPQFLKISCALQGVPGLKKKLCLQGLCKKVGTTRTLLTFGQQVQQNLLQETQTGQVLNGCCQAGRENPPEARFAIQGELGMVSTVCCSSSAANSLS